MATCSTDVDIPQGYAVAQRLNTSQLKDHIRNIPF